MRKMIKNFENGESISIKELGLEGYRIKRIYTIIDEKLLHMESKVLEQQVLKHNQNVFIESFIDDWQIRRGMFHFYGHSGAKGQHHHILIEYVEGEV